MANLTTLAIAHPLSTSGSIFDLVLIVGEASKGHPDELYGRRIVRSSSTTVCTLYHYHSWPGPHHVRRGPGANCTVPANGRNTFLRLLITGGAREAMPTRAPVLS